MRFYKVVDSYGTPRLLEGVVVTDPDGKRFLMHYSTGSNQTIAVPFDGHPDGWFDSKNGAVDAVVTEVRKRHDAELAKFTALLG